MWKRIQVFSVVVFLVLAIAPLALASSDCDFSYSNYARAVQLHDMGDYDAALRHYNCALEEDPDDAVIPLLIANVHEDIANASRAWSSAAHPTTAEILELPPVSTWGEREHPSREQDFDDLIVIESADSDPSAGLAEFLVTGLSVRVGRSGHALWYFYRSGNSGFGLVLIADQAARGSSPDFAAENLDPADELIRQARVFARNLDWTRARIRFEQALALDPERVDFRRELDLARQALGDERAVLIRFDIALAQDPVDAPESSNRDEFIRQARIFTRNLDWARARIRFEQALDLDPNRIDIRCELGMVYLELDDERAALRQFDIVLAQDPVDACARPNRDALMQGMRDG